MKKKAKIVIIVMFCIALVVIAGYLVIGNPVVFINNQNLKNSILSIESDTVCLNEVVPFDWDILYSFESYPYESKERLEDIVGFKSADIKENYINTGMVHLLFVKDNKVVASILAYRDYLGYNLSFPSKLTFLQNAQFNVTISDGIVLLTYTE